MKLSKFLSCPPDAFDGFCVPRCWGHGYPCWPEPFPPKPWPWPKPWEDPRLMDGMMDIVSIIV